MSEVKGGRTGQWYVKRVLVLAFAVALAASGLALSSSSGSQVSDESPRQLELSGPGRDASAAGTRPPRDRLATVRSAVYPESAIISNGTVQLGINPTGNLNVYGGTPSSGEGTKAVGLRYVATNADATSPGCLCEGWGVADADEESPNAGVTGYANVATDSGPHHLRVIEFTNTGESAQSVVDVLGDDGETPIMRVTHDYEPFPGSPNLYDAEVSVENLTGNPIGDLRYRRVMDWDVEPTAFSEYVTIDGDHDSEFLHYSSDNGFATANPLAGPSSLGSVGFFTDAGPEDHGALFDFSFGSLAPLENRSFDIFYGAAGNELDATAAVAAAQAEVWSFGEPNTTDGPSLGTPNTFIFGFSGIGGAGSGSDARPPVTLATSAPSHLPVGTQEFEATARLDNTSNSAIADGSVRVDPGPDLTVVSGPNPAALGLLPAESAPHGPSATWKLLTPAPECGASQSYGYDIYGDFAGSGTAGGERHVHRTVTVPRTCGTVHGATTWEELEGVETVASGPEEGAQVSVCPTNPGGPPCRLAKSAADGGYSVEELPVGDYTIEARPNPSGPHASLPPQTKALHISMGGSVSQSFQFSTLLKPPPGSGVSTPGFGGVTEDGYPLLYWGDPIQLTTTTKACAHPTVTYAITQGDPVIVTLSSGTMTEGPTGTFTAVAPPVFPHHGYARVTFTVHCADPKLDPEPIEFDVYIDPSGFVRTVDGSPLPGASVTLLRAASASGPFSAVANGSTVMSPANRRNPDLTDAGGHFGWDVSAGFYRVRAEKAGCHAPGDSSRASVESSTYAVPPPVTDIDLRLECPPSVELSRPKAGIAKAGIAKARRVALVRHGKALLKMRCTGEGACEGMAKLLAGRHSEIGKHRFALAAGHSGIVGVALDRGGLRLLRDAGKGGLKAKLTGSGLNPAAVTLRPASSGKSRK